MYHLFYVSLIVHYYLTPFNIDNLLKGISEFFINLNKFF